MVASVARLARCRVVYTAIHATTPITCRSRPAVPRQQTGQRCGRAAASLTLMRRLCSARRRPGACPEPLASHTRRPAQHGSERASARAPWRRRPRRGPGARRCRRAACVRPAPAMPAGCRRPHSPYSRRAARAGPARAAREGPPLRAPSRAPPPAPPAQGRIPWVLERPPALPAYSLLPWVTERPTAPPAQSDRP